MSKALLTIVAFISLAGVAHAQSKFGDITMSSDPAKAAAIEQQAADLKAQQSRAMAHSPRHAMHHHLPHVAGPHHSKTKTPLKS
jgi:hypothetical protein